MWTTFTPPTTPPRRSARWISTAFRNPVNELPDGCVQMYLRDPSGNLIEIDWPDVATLDRSRIPELKPLTAFAAQNAEGLKASLYLDRPHLKTARRAGA